LLPRPQVITLGGATVKGSGGISAMIENKIFYEHKNATASDWER